MSNFVKCHYCPQQAQGINYKPRPELKNTAACFEHQTSLFIPFSKSESQKSGQAIQTQYMNRREQRNLQFFQKFMQIFMQQFNSMQEEVLNCEQKIKNIHQQQVQSFVLPCSITNPYMLLKQDYDMMGTTLLTRVKARLDQSKRKNINLQNLSSPQSYQSPQRIRYGSMYESESPNLRNLKVSMMTTVSRDSKQNKQGKVRKSSEQKQNIYEIHDNSNKMNIFKSCFQPNHHISSLQSPFDQQYLKQTEPHQRLSRDPSTIPTLVIRKQSNSIANRLQVRGAWQHRGEQVDYKEAAFKQQKYREFIGKTRGDMNSWNMCFQEEYQ